ncbi:unnamed protein product [Cuscuta campestris]|uniref:Reverse transcriptase domain-containing protein n=1 Tax=Cuscuta campestris TaxID=132261 RepID=A0A484NDS2_9ASTE|nr:unnamed protein product [Cuscuta campestris]
MPFQDRLQFCVRKLSEWGGDKFQRFGKRRKELCDLIQRVRKRRDEEGCQILNKADKELSKLLDQEDIYSKQRAKQHWLCAGDRNTRFFHQYASYRRRKNQIHGLMAPNGKWCEGPNLMSLVRDNYNSLFHSNGAANSGFLDSLTPCISVEQNTGLLRPFEESEVNEALFTMHPDKSHGPDGMNPGFYQKSWETVGSDVTQFVLKCIKECLFSDGMNDTTLVLIPKKQTPKTVADLRPIALCNTTYKTISKMVANRLKPLLQHVISDNQFAFLPGRLISDNILLAVEMGHYLHRKQLGLTGWVGLKLDMAKAYDRVEWGFLRKMMEKLGFDSRWIELVMLYELVPTRGLRQGDPLRPYLFILCVEGLSLMLKEAERKRLIHGIRVARGAPPVTHLFFADDSLLFFKASDEEAGQVRQPLASVFVVVQAENFGGWNLEVVQSLFCPRDMDQISRVPLQLDSEDKWY